MTIQETFDGDALPLLGNRSLYTLDPIITDIVPAKPKNQTLDYPTCSCKEVRISSPLTLCEHIKGLLQVTLMRLLEELIG